MNVDPAILRQFAAALDDAAGVIHGLDTVTPFRPAETALPGTGFQSACATSSAAAMMAVQALANRARAVGDVARGVAQNYEISDDEFASKMVAMGGRR